MGRVDSKKNGVGRSTFQKQHEKTFYLLVEWFFFRNIASNIKNYNHQAIDL